MKKRIVAWLLASCMLAMMGCVDNNSASSESGNTGDWSSSSSFNDDSSSSSKDSSSSNGCVEHVDENSDGLCETCKESTIRTFQFFALNDLHGKFTDSDTQIGVEEMSTYLKQAREENPNTLFLSSGDMWQGGAESNSTKGLIMTDWMNEMGFVSMTLGNHEYDWGEEYIIENEKLANFPFLAINIYDVETNERVEYCDASVMVEQDGAKIGIIGAMGDCYGSIAGDKKQGVTFKTGSELTALVKAEANRLKAEGADYIIYSIHDEGEYDESLSNGYIDLVFEGHTHQLYTNQDRYGVYNLQNGGDNTGGVSKATVEINIANETAKETYAGVIRSSAYANLAEDPIVETLLAKYAEMIGQSNKVLGINSSHRNSDEIAQTVVDLYYQAGMKKWGEEYNIVLAGGAINVRSPYDIPVGEVTYGYLQMILPFDNYLVLCSIKGSDLQRRFFNNSSYVLSYGAYGANIKNNIQANQTYYIITDSWSSLYAPNNLTEIEKYDDNKTFARDFLAQYIQTGAWEDKTPISLTSIPDILSIGKALPYNGETSVEYDVEGTITSFTNTTYGNFYIKDDQGNTLYIYGVYDRSGNRYDGMKNPPQVGDKVILRGKIMNYQNNQGSKIEIINAKMMVKNGETQNV
ncbi:MAG: metallophosphoesterase [Clostridia bacterium]|nr:metallophosphoesterase [Clostridia bacterium]